MIFSPDHKFIFIHVPKAAGTSVNAALSLHDVFHPVARTNLATRRQFAQAQGLPVAMADFTTHASAAQYIDALGAEAFAAFFSFAFVRNPWDVAVSWFHYRLINPAISGHAEASKSGTFARYVMDHLAGPNGAKLAGPQHPYLTSRDGKLAVSFVGRYETFERDYAAVLERLQVKPLELDRLNQSYHAPWPQLYTRETFAIVAQLVEKDAALFGYATDPAAYGIP